MTLISATILLLLVIDPFGGIPLFLAALKNVEERKRRRIILRECFIAFMVLFLFMLFGEKLLFWLQVSRTSLGIAGGTILFIIALRIVFPTSHGVFGDLPQEEPFIVPLAIPLIAGPSALATVLLMVSRWPSQFWQWVLALCIAIAISMIVLGFADKLARFLGKRGIMAIERLMGLILMALAVEMFLEGVKEFVHHL